MFIDRVKGRAWSVGYSQVARLLMDTSVLQFYPTLFVLATDVMDMVGEMVWQRIKQKAEFSEDGNVICSLPGFITFRSSDLIFFLYSITLPYVIS